MQVTQSIKPLDGESEGIEQPHDQDAVAVMMTDVFQLVLALGRIKTLIFYLPAAFSHAEQRACADPLWR